MREILSREGNNLIAGEACDLLDESHGVKY